MSPSCLPPLGVIRTGACPSVQCKAIIQRTRQDVQQVPREDHSVMKKLVLALVIAAFLALPLAAQASFSLALVKNSVGSPCGTSCQYVVCDGGCSVVQVWANTSVFNYPYSYWDYDTGRAWVGSSRPFTSNIDLSIAANGHQYSFYARQLCPNGLSWKFSAVKYVIVSGTYNYLNIGALQIVDNGGCGTARTAG